MERAEATGVTPVHDRRALAGSERTIKRRRRFSLEEKRTILKAAGEPGATVSEVSRQYGVRRSVILSLLKKRFGYGIGLATKAADDDVR